MAAQIAGASLLIGYVLTVAVSASAGMSALMAINPANLGVVANDVMMGTSALIYRPHFWDIIQQSKATLPLMAIAFIAVMNLRGIKESGKLFAIPTLDFLFA